MQQTNVPTRSSLLKRPLTTLDLEFRLAEEDDLPKLEWMGEYTHFRRVFHYTYEDQQMGRRLMLLAIFNNFPIGQIFMLVKDFWNGERGYLYSLRVMEPFRGMGIGSDLILQAENMLIARHLSHASIAVARDNPAARRLYERLGYHVYAEDEGRWSYDDQYGRTIHVHEPCWMMEKQLL